MPRVALAACFHETNTFASTRTGLGAFQRKGWFAGADLAAAYAGTRTVVGGFLDGAAAAGLEPVCVFGAYATPAGMVTADAFGRIVDRIVDGVCSAGAVDGVLLELHGAMVVDGDDDPETTLVRALRARVPDLPVAAVTDLHANITADLVDAVDVLIGYRTNPHVDTYDRGADAARHLASLLSDRQRPHAKHVSAPVLAAPIAQATADMPLLRLLNRARELQRQHRLLDVSVHGGYAYADVPHAGLSFTVTGGDAAGVTATLDELAALGIAHRKEFAIALPDPEEAFDRAAAADGGPVAIADTGDNIGGGAAGDGTWLLRAALQRRDVRTLVSVCDPEVVQQATAAGVDGRLECQLGGKSEPMAGGPVEVEATVRWTGDGTFTNTGPMAQGARVSMGPAAVLAVGPVHVAVQTLPVQPNDPQLFRCMGLDPHDYAVIVLKGAAALRAGWRPLVCGFVDAGTPGVTDSAIERMPYRRLRRPMWPLDRLSSPGGDA